MKLPGIESACITEAKLSGYLLSLEHPSGRDKARFFISLGFHPRSPDVLRLALLQHAASHAVSSVQRTLFGTKYVVDGDIRGPAGDAARIRSIWFVEPGDVRPRLVTAYPLRG